MAKRAKFVWRWCFRERGCFGLLMGIAERWILQPAKRANKGLVVRGGEKAEGPFSGRSRCLCSTEFFRQPATNKHTSRSTFPFRV